MKQDVGIADQQKAGKQGQDDSINNSVYNRHTLTAHEQEATCSIVPGG